MSSLKQQLYQYCLEHLTQQEQNIRQVIDAARESAANETKSSAGDKYETAREMLQQDIDRGLAQLAVCRQLHDTLSLIDVSRESLVIIPGSIVVTDQGNYFIAVPAGKTMIGKVNYYTISLASPIGRLLAGNRAGTEISFQDKTIRILEVQ